MNDKKLKLLIRSITKFIFNAELSFNFLGHIMIIIHTLSDSHNLVL